jgi:cyclic pyranopterin phosphate synthase
MTTNGILLDKYAQLLADSGLQRVNVSLDSLDQQKYHKITRRGHLNDVLRGIQAAEEAGLQPIKLNMVINRYTTTEDKDELHRFAARHGFPLRFIHEMQLNNGTFTRVEGGDGGNCTACNRIRLTADGKLKPCLFSSLAYDVRELGIENALKLSLENKPKAGSVNTHERFSQIGG